MESVGSTYALRWCMCWLNYEHMKGDSVEYNSAQCCRQCLHGVEPSTGLPLPRRRTDFLLNALFTDQSRSGRLLCKRSERNGSLIIQRPSWVHVVAVHQQCGGNWVRISAFTTTKLVFSTKISPRWMKDNRWVNKWQGGTWMENNRVFVCCVFSCLPWLLCTSSGCWRWGWSSVHWSLPGPGCCALL